MSPSRNLDNGPPTALSGTTCSTTVPNPVPLIRPSVIRSMSVTPWPSSMSVTPWPSSMSVTPWPSSMSVTPWPRSLEGIGMLPHCGMAIRAGPHPASTRTEAGVTSKEAGVTSKEGESIRLRIS